MGSGSFDAYVFEATAGTDFTISLYGSGYGDRYSPNPAALIASADADWGVGQLTVPTLPTPEPVSLVVFSNEGYHDIAIDNLQVTAIPAPGAVLLGSLGAGLVGYWRRRKTL